MRVVMDCGNAAACIVAPEIFKKLNIDLEKMYCDVDGNFPNHHPDPTVDSNLSSIVDKIKQGSFDLGIAYDGDGDRVVCIDSFGNIIRSDVLMCVFVKDILSKIDNKKIIYDVKCSSALKDVILNEGGDPIEWKTGHSLIKSKMKLEESSFGGEMSGHIFFGDNYYGYDDAIYVSLRLIEILSNTNSSLFDLVSEIPKYFSTPELRFECVDDQKKFNIMNDLRNSLESKYSCSTVDGIKVFIENGWGLLRASNTQPVIVCRAEAKTVESLENIKKILSFNLSKHKGIKFEF
jgi:phosphomannomutase/phosphoglucomutase